MDFTEPSHITELREVLRRFLAAEAPLDVLTKWDKANEIPLWVVDKLAELGLFSVTVPEEYGGLGNDVLAMVAIIEELARAAVNLSGIFIMGACYGALNITNSGSDEQKKKFLPLCAEGKLRFAYGLSEPEVGSDLASVKTRAERKGDKVIINGAKRWCSAADVSHYIFMLVRSGDPDARYKNLSIILVPPDSPGLTMMPIRVMGVHGTSTMDVYLDNVEVSADLILGGDAGWNNGWKFLTSKALEAEKLEVPAQALGVAQAAVDEAWKYSQERQQFGQRICSFQAIRHTLAECQTKLQAARLMVYWAASQVQKGVSKPYETSMTKLFVTETAKEIVLSCQQVLGAYGYAEGFGMERYVRDVVVLPIYGGSSAIQRNNISNLMGLPKS